MRGRCERPGLSAVVAGALLLGGCSSERLSLPVSLAFTAQPSNSTANSPLSSVEVTVLDAFGNPATGATAPVIVTLGSGAGGAALSGTLAVLPASGVATFDDLVVDSAGSGYTLVAASAGVAPAISDTFDVAVPISFADLGAGLLALGRGGLDWGDFDADGDLDLIVTGVDDAVTPRTRLYRNDGGGTFTVVAGPPDAGFGAVAWGDYDHDGDLDLALSGLDGTFSPLTRIYRNDGGTFTDIVAGLTPLYFGDLAWGDHDNDGDLDLIVVGDTGVASLTTLYRNDGSDIFTLVVTPGLDAGLCPRVDWGDQDNDGDLDLVYTAATGGGNVVTVYRNDGGGTFVDIGAGLTGYSEGNVQWGDYDGDGDLDLAACGDVFGAAPPETVVYRNDGGTFVDIGAALTGVRRGAVAWADHDADGDLDLLVVGYDAGSAAFVEVYRNDAGTFTALGAGLQGVDSAAAAWGDEDGDGTLELALMGVGPSGSVTTLYDVVAAPANAAPAAPAGLGAAVAGAVTLTWSPASDAETPAAGLSYNLRLGLSPGASDRFPAMADTTTGRRRVARPGVVQTAAGTPSIALTLPSGTYYWSVQAIDGGRRGSVWASESSFVVP